MMPLWKGQPYTPTQLTLGLQNDVPVLLIRFTGEVFQYYECVSWPLMRIHASQKPNKTPRVTFGAIRPQVGPAISP